MDIVDLLHREIWKESVAHAPRVPGSVEAMKLAVEEIQRWRNAVRSHAIDKLARIHPESKEADDWRRLIKEAEGRAG